MKPIPLSVPHIKGNAGTYINECIDTEWVSTVGPFVKRFEDAIAAYCEVKFAVATSSGTTALHLALIAAGVEADDEVLAPTVSFVATINPIRYVGAYPVLVDVTRENWCIDVKLVERFLSENCQVRDGKPVNKATGRIVKAIVPVHVFGQAANLRDLKEVANRFNLKIIEDGAESLGGRLAGKRLGTIGDIGILSFNGNKIITAGSGGAIITNDEFVANLTRHLSTQAKSDPLAFDHDRIGYNYRMSNLHAALGLSQLELLESYLEIKSKIAKRYLHGLEDLIKKGAIELQVPVSDSISNNWLNVFLVEKGRFDNGTRAAWKFVVDQLSKSGIESRPIWTPLHRLKPHLNLEFVGGDVADDICSRGVCLPSSVGLDEQDQDRVIDAVKRLFL